jgi:hypothetical protein
MRSLFIGLVVIFMVTGCFKGEGKIRVVTDQDDSMLYVDGDKKMMVGQAYENLFLTEGEYELEVKKPIDEKYAYYGKKVVFVGENTSTKVTIDTKKVLTAEGKEIVAKEKKAEEIKLAKKKEEEKRFLAKYKDVKNIFVDVETKLIWQDDYAAKTIEKPWVTQANWDAKNDMDRSGDTATTYCKKLSLGGFNDWRLPSKNELKGLYEKKNKLINLNFRT